jgi:hypothetical protein
VGQISLTGDYILSELVSPGQSGQFFYFSYDLRFMLKTITRGEAKFLKAILPKYYNVRVFITCLHASLQLDRVVTGGWVVVS